MPPPASTSPRRSARVSWDEGAYAGFARRAAGFVVDLLLLSVVLSFLVPLTLGPGFDPAALDPANPPAATQWLVLVVIVYDVVMTSQLGWTLGKRAVGIEVRSADGRLPSPGLALGRFFSRYLSALPLFLGFAWALFDPRKQTWHDKLCETYVLKRSRLVGDQSAAPTAEPRPVGWAPARDDPNRTAIAQAGLAPDERAWLEEVAAQVEPRLDRVSDHWRALPSAGAARATAFGLLLGHLARLHPGSREALSDVAEAHPSYNALLAGSRLSTLEAIVEDPQRVATWLGPLVGERDVERISRLLR